MALLEALALAGVAVVLILFVGRYALRPLLRLTAGTGSRDVFVAIVLLIMGAIALMTSAAGLSLALGAFLAGLLLSESEYRHQIEVDIEPFRGLLLGLFFMTVGMGIDPVAIWDDIIWLLGVALAVIVLKAAILFAVFIAFRVKRDTAAETALLLGQAGEFVFVVLALARSSGTVSAQTAQFFILVASTTMILTPLLAKLASRAGQAMRSEPDTSDSAPPTGADLEGHVIIGGFGRVGRIVARVLELENVPYVALDMDIKTVQRARREGHNLYFGDASRVDILKRVSCSQSQAVVITLDEPKAAERMAANARKIAPQAMVFARAKDNAHANRLAKIGINWVVPEAVEGSLRLADRLLEGLGYPREAAQKLIGNIREDEERLS